MTDEAKIIADEISIVTDKELNEYQSHGRKMTAPKGRAAVKNKRYPRKSGGDAPASRLQPAPKGTGNHRQAAGKAGNCLCQGQESERPRLAGLAQETVQPKPRPKRYHYDSGRR